MMTTDQRITDDLAILGRISRARPSSLEATLRAVRAAPSTPDVARETLARVFGARVARAAAGLAASAGMTGIVVWLGVPRSVHAARDRGLDVELLELGRAWLALSVISVVVAGYAGASWLAARGFRRSLANARMPLETARGLVRRADRWATVASITGIAAFVVGFGMLEVVVGDVGLISLFRRDATIELIRQVMIATLSGAFATIAIGALALVRTYSGARRHPAWLIPAGVVLGFATLVAGARFDTGPLLETIARSERPLVGLRVALTFTGALAVLLVTAGAVLGQRRRALRTTDEL